MANDCLPQLAACAERVTRLEPNGVPDPGANNLYVSDALTILTVTPVYSEGEEIEQKNACGNVCLNYKDDDRLKRLDIELTLCTPDPQLHEMLAGGTVLTSGTDVGYAYPALNAVPNPYGVSIELWAKRIDDGDLAADSPYAWWVLPKVRSLKLGARSFENAPQLSVFTGQAVENPNWFNGPSNDWPVASTKVAQWIPTDAYPTPTCGYRSLSAS